MRVWRFLGLLALLLLAPAVIVLAEDWPWPADADPVRISPDLYARHTSVDVAAGKTAVAWAGTSAHTGVYLAEWAGNWQGSDVVTLTTAAGSRFPSLAYSGTHQVVVAWLQGSGAGTLMQQDVGKGAAQAVMSPVYGDAFPHLLVGEDALHLTFAGAALDVNVTKGDLYYASRSLNQATWSAPTVVVTRAQVTPQEAGGVWYPRMALSNDGQQVNIVWEQTTSTISRTVWYISGQQQGNSVVWAQPMQLSPQGQMAVRPSIAASAGNQLHVVWSEIAEGTESRPEAQYINYRRFSGVSWSAPTRVDADPVNVNSLFPTKSSPQIAVYGTQVCIAWHGYRSGEGGSKEEILLRCSENDGLSWLTKFNVSENAGALSLFPALEIDTLKQVHLAWQEQDVSGGASADYEGAFYRMGPIYFRSFLPVVLKNRS